MDLQFTVGLRCTFDDTANPVAAFAFAGDALRYAVGYVGAGDRLLIVEDTETGRTFAVVPCGSTASREHAAHEQVMRGIEIFVGAQPR